MKSGARSWSTLGVFLLPVVFQEMVLTLPSDVLQLWGGTCPHQAPA